MAVTIKCPRCGNLLQEESEGVDNIFRVYHFKGTLSMMKCNICKYGDTVYNWKANLKIRSQCAPKI